MRNKLFLIFYKLMRYLLKKKYIKTRTFFLVVGRVGIEAATTLGQLSVIEKLIDGGINIEKARSD